MKDNVIIFDTTLRDGEQSPGASMNTNEKLRLAVQLEKLGIDVMEAGFPAASDGDFEAVSRIAGRLKKTIVAGLARANKPDIDRAWQAIRHAAKPRIHTFIATSDIHLDYKLKMSREEVLASAVESVSRNLCGWLFQPRHGCCTVRLASAPDLRGSGLADSLSRPGCHSTVNLPDGTPLHSLA